MHHLVVTLAVSSLALPAQAQIRFVEVTDSAGVAYMQNEPGSPGTGAMLAMCGGAAAGDYDGDGWVDLFVTVINGTPRLFRNLGEDGNGVHQGFADEAASAFLPAPPVGRQNGAAFGDVDGDGDLDLLVTGIISPQHFLWINDGAGHFTEEGVNRGLVLAGSASQQGFSASFGDYDRDGYLDLYITEWGHLIETQPPPPSNSRLLRNLGAASPGYFEDVTEAAGVALEDSQPSGPFSGTWQGVYSFTPRFADFDDDGWPDLAIAGDFGTSRLFWNDGNGSTFSDGTASAGVGGDQNGMGAAVADFDRDGVLDWFVTAIYDPFDTCNTSACNWGSSGNRLYLGRGSRIFTDATDTGVRDGGWGWGATEIDFDNDGWLDLAMTNGIDFTMGPTDDHFNHDPTKLFRNTGGGFEEVAARVGIVDRRSGKGIVKLDYDRDGDQDLLVVNAVDRPVFYRNDGGNAADWLQVELAGSGPNTACIGARVLVWPDAGDDPLLREQSASSNYLSQNETLLHFGLGQDSVVQRVEIRWPGGLSTVLQDVPSRQRIVVSEP